MNTILPKGFVFDSSKALTPNRVHNDILAKFGSFAHHNKIESNLIICALILIFGIIMIKVIKSRSDSLLNGLLLIFSTCGLMASVLAIFIVMVFPSSFANDCEFEFKPNSNLIVKQNIPGNSNNIQYVNVYSYDPKQLNQPVFDHENNAYPYKVYVRDNLTDSDKLVYLGQVKRDEKVLLNYETAAGRTFAMYCNYIDAHHLNNKFTKTLKFKRDPQLLNADGVPQYVLKGDGITLKVKSLQPQKYQVYVDKD